jgi:hypothetical protein
MPNPTFAPGFRLSARDVGVLVIGSVASVAVVRLDAWPGIAIAFVVAHFFLFCNILRLSRPLELTWAAVFSGLAIATTSFTLISWPAVLACSSGLTLALALIAIRRPSYHGLGWQTLNPGLRQWWSVHGGTR